MPEPQDLPCLPPPRCVDAGGCTLCYYVAGPFDGHPLMLCHGLAAGALQFADDMAWFAGQGFRVIVPDLRGHGRSGMPERDDSAAFSISRLADDLLTILDTEGVAETAWVGNSLGGILALELMGRTPQRLARVTLFGTAFALGLPPLAGHGIALGYALCGAKRLAPFMARLTCRDPGAQRVIRETFLAARPAAVTAIAAHVRHYDLAANARGFGKPLMIIRGSADRAVNRALPRAVAAMHGRAGFSLVELEGAGHCANLDRPQAFRRIVLDFLTAAPAS